MPIYDYVCASCRHRTEVIHGINDAGPKFCPNCGAEGTLRKALTTPAVHFKGSGWAKKDRSTASASRAKSGAAEGGSSDGAAGDAKSGDAQSGEAKSGEGGTKADASSKNNSASTSDTGTGARASSSSSED